MAGIELSVTIRGDNLANALVETINNLYMAKLIHRRAPLCANKAIELATMEKVVLSNHHLLLNSTGCIPTADAELN